MKRIVTKIALLSILAASTVFAHSHSLAMHKKWLELPSLLGLSRSQQVHFKRYFDDTHRDMMKVHNEAVENLQKILSHEQFEQLMCSMHGMMRKGLEPKNDDEIKALVTKEANLLLLSANQESELQITALTFHHKLWELKNQFYLRLSKILTPAQQEKLAKIWKTKE